MARCKICKTLFKKRSITHYCCSPECAIKFCNQEKEKRIKTEIKKRREAIKSRSQWLKEAQVTFNAYIRARDYGKPCISCQKNSGAKMNAGHYRSVGAAPELRFEELNVHLQCEHCNTHLSSNAIEYRINLVKLIGADKVEWLEGPHEPKKYTIDDAKNIKMVYKLKLKELKNALS